MGKGAGKSENAVHYNATRATRKADGFPSDTGAVARRVASVAAGSAGNGNEYAAATERDNQRDKCASQASASNGRTSHSVGRKNSATGSRRRHHEYTGSDDSAGQSSGYTNSGASAANKSDSTTASQTYGRATESR